MEALVRMSLMVSINIFYGPSCHYDQQTIKGSFGHQVKLPPTHLSTTNGGGFTLSFLLLNVKQENCDYQFF